MAYSKDKMKEYRLSRIEDWRDKVGKIAEHYGCNLCGEKDRVVLDFHHYDESEKEFGIGDGIVKLLSWEKILKEIDKCVVLCANCHRKVHAKKLVVNESMKCNFAGYSVLVSVL